MSASKNDPTPARENRDGGKGNTSAAKPDAAAFRTRMSLEKKLGIAFIGALLTVFFGVLGVRLYNVDDDGERVDINLSSETEGSAPATGTHLTAVNPSPTPQPTVVAERSPPPMSPFAGSPPPQMKSPPAAYMPPAPTNPAPAPQPMTMGATPAPRTTSSFGSPPPAGYAAAANGNAGSRYGSPTSSPVVAPVAPPATTMATSNAPTDAAGNPLRSAGSPPMPTSNGIATSSNTAMPSASYGAPVAATNNGATYGAPATPYGASPAAAAVSMPSNNTGNGYATAPATTPPAATLPPMNAAPPSYSAASNEPRPIAGAAGSASPMDRGPGVASIGIASNGGQSYSPTPAAPLANNIGAQAAMTQAPVAVVPQAKPYVVAPGDSFWTIAQQAYGDGSYYRALYAYNSDRYPHAEDVRTGSVLDIPSADVLKAKFPELVAGGSATISAGGESPAMTGRGNVAVAAKTYVVQEGDTLFDIARRQLGKASYWSEIYNLNRAALGDNLERLKPGTELMLPAVQQ